MEHVKLIDSKDKWISAGTVFRFPVYDFFAGQKIIEIMMCMSPNTWALFVFYPIAGYESGKLFGAQITEKFRENTIENAVAKSWLVDNWYDQIYPNSNLSEVHIYRRPAPLTIPTLITGQL